MSFGIRAEERAVSTYIRWLSFIRASGPSTKSPNSSLAFEGISEDSDTIHSLREAVGAGRYYGASSSAISFTGTIVDLISRGARRREISLGFPRDNAPGEKDNASGNTRDWKGMITRLPFLSTECRGITLDRIYEAARKVTDEM
ncbi:hypothetical protein EAG_03026 [Camponotus floridanus]|uniref:Uncharacterized protein n=1 Tax=Camponotus floridanus TaxID=104421 RepID=E2ARM2_CAMFO|nr:hypothetical protein EAG_03026 [Camponotus floridanus]